MKDMDQRQHRRLAIRLPLECSPRDLWEERPMRTVTTNISTGGVYFEADLIDDVSVPRLHSLMDIALTVPPGDGYFPYEGRVTSVAEVIRCDPLKIPESAGPETTPRVGIAARFKEPLRLSF